MKNNLYIGQTLYIEYISSNSRKDKLWKLMQDSFSNYVNPNIYSLDQLRRIQTIIEEVKN